MKTEQEKNEKKKINNKFAAGNKSKAGFAIFLRYVLGLSVTDMWMEAWQSFERS